MSKPGVLAPFHPPLVSFTMIWVFFVGLGVHPGVNGRRIQPTNHQIEEQ